MSHAAAHIGHASCNPYLGSWRKFDHLHKLSRMHRSSVASAPCSTLIVALPGNSIWIAPAAAACSPRCSAVTIAVSVDMDTLTGSSAAYGSASSPFSNERRHLKTWLALTPYERATLATLAPGSIVSCTICGFSATDRHLRDRRPEATSSAYTMHRWSRQIRHRARGIRRTLTEDECMQSLHLCLETMGGRSRYFDHE